ncbi:hypothetical protein AKO1_007689 [Acrasis kona]|uniref:Aminoacyl-histidine dipeptidase n=1 Tax=Acrasis kona TaxID=1008807 RepID=A0AAW2YPX7_9EUKA
MTRFTKKYLLIVLTLCIQAYFCTTVKELQPNIVWTYFSDLAATPRPSFHSSEVTSYLFKFAQQNNFKYKTDDVGNIVIVVPATKGFEDKPITCLQTHTDMVAEKNIDKHFDFEKDAIELLLDGDWVRANNTTLGADDGIGCAISLAIATDSEASHGPLELVFTIDEEVGLIGAINMDKKLLDCSYLLNLDNSVYGTIYVGSAGGINTVADFEFDSLPLTVEQEESRCVVQVLVTGLHGGHSGNAIHKQPANAAKVLATLMFELLEAGMDILLIDVDCGHADNAIPRESSAIVSIPKNIFSQVQHFTQTFQHNQDTLVEPDIRIQVQYFENDQHPTGYNETFTLFQVLNALPYGVISYNLHMPGQIETSTNLALVKTTHLDNKLNITITTMQRSTSDHSRKYISDQVKSVFYLANASRVRTEVEYGGWHPDLTGELLKVAINSFGGPVKTKATHAGLECGEIKSKYPSLQMISYGPDIVDAHTPNERVRIESVRLTYEFTKRLLKGI